MAKYTIDVVFFEFTNVFQKLPLHIACLRGNLEIIFLLLEDRHIDFSTKTKSNRVLLDYCLAPTVRNLISEFPSKFFLKVPFVIMRKKFREKKSTSKKFEKLEINAFTRIQFDRLEGLQINYQYSH